jgi:hypothetical protein
MWRVYGKFWDSETGQPSRGKQIKFISLYQETRRVVSNLVYLETLNVSNLLVIQQLTLEAPRFL